MSELVKDIAKEGLQAISLDLLLLKKKSNNLDKFIFYKNYEEFDLNKQLIHSPSNTFIIRTVGDSMIGCGINPNDLLIVDRCIKPENGMVVIAEIDNKITVKKFFSNDKEIILKSANINYPDIILAHTDNFKIWGVVTSVIRTL